MEADNAVVAAGRVGRLTIAAGLLLAAASLPSVGLAQKVGSVKPAPVEGKAIGEAPESRAEAEQSIDAALAASLIGAITTQFDEPNVQVQLDHVQTDPINLIDLGVRGDGQLRIGAEDDWLPLRFSAIYDSVAATVAQPRIVLGSAEEQGGSQVAAHSGIAQSLQVRVTRRLQEEFPQQSLRLHLDRVEQWPAGKRHARIDAIGSVVFGGQGSSSIHVRALYAPEQRAWKQLFYELDAGSSRNAVSPAAE